MIPINKNTTASFDVDPQNSFTPRCPNELPVPGGDEIASELNKQAVFASFRIGSKDAHSPDSEWAANEENPQFTPIEGKNMDIRWNMHCVPGTFGFKLIDGLPDEDEYDYFVWKGVETDMHPYGAVYHDLEDKLSTGVIEVLKFGGFSTVIVGGLATDYCVKTTALQLLRAGFEVIVNLAACRGIAETTIQAAITEMKDAGAVLINSSDELMEMRNAS